MEMKKTPNEIRIRGARVHNLKNVDVNIPLHGIVGIAGVSGSGQIVAGARGALRRRVAALSGGVVHLYAPAHDAGSQGAGR